MNSADVFARAEAQVDADRRAIAEQEARGRTAYREAQASRAVRAVAARERVREAQVDVRGAEDEFSVAATARVAGTGSTAEVEAAWRALDVARRELAAAQAVAADLGA